VRGREVKVEGNGNQSKQNKSALTVTSTRSSSALASILDTCTNSSPCRTNSGCAASLITQTTSPAVLPPPS
jgi:hypothetical protein